MKPIQIALAAVVLAVPDLAHAQAPSMGPQAPQAAEGSFDPQSLSIATNLGLLQPLLLGGANLELDIRYKWLVISYSHGWSLDFEGSSIVGAMRDQGISLHVPYTTGFGIGPSFWLGGLNTFVDFRLEPKVHRFEATYEVDGVRRPVAEYSTYTVGGGAYATFLPFASSAGPVRGLNASLSFRVWPNVATSLPNNRTEYQNAKTGSLETHSAANIGIANTPIVVNMSVGYVFQ